MAKLEVLHYPDARLRKKATPVESIDQSIRNLAEDMLETMYSEGGIGLAATQINIQQRIIVIDLSSEKNDPMYLINPEILSHSGTAQSEEGCLSVPGYYDLVERAENISYRYLNLDGNSIEVDADGLLAICVQHEIDHLDGKLFIDYLSPLKRQRLSKKLEKQEKLQAQLL